ncbi:hypothetical protein B5807_10131 [Epicoccum nigrum]|uniref:Uncharacterized protein n=1 Tax=Epicoccum nigrum TaxID=105696 RepID=A0A1Y2LP28_EPING|nr:hypothetical protein B5807_10131 [Epicoccum nigrum]
MAILIPIPQITTNTTPPIRLHHATAPRTQRLVERTHVDRILHPRELIADDRGAARLMVHVCCAAILPIAPAALDLAEEVADGVEQQRDGDEGDGDDEADAEHEFEHVRHGQAGLVAAGLVREFLDVDGEEGGDEAEGEEDNGDDGEYHDCLALAGGPGGLVAGKAGLECVGVFLLEIEEVGDGFVDALCLLVHAFQIFDVGIDSLQLVSEMSLEILLWLVLFFVDVRDRCLEIWNDGALILKHFHNHVELVADVLSLGQQVCLSTDIQKLVYEKRCVGQRGAIIVTEVIFFDGRVDERVCMGMVRCVAAVLMLTVSVLSLKVSREAARSSVVLQPSRGLSGGCVELLEKHRFHLGSIADTALEHVQELIVLITHTVPIKDTAATLGDDCCQIIHTTNRLLSLAVHPFDDAIEYVQWIIARLLPSLRKCCHYQVLTQDPHPQLVYHENLGINESIAS